MVILELLSSFGNKLYLSINPGSYRQKKGEGSSLPYFFQAFQKKKAAIITKTKPVMPLTSLDDNIMLAGSMVVSMASPNKIAANIMTSNPNIMYSVFMDNYFPWHYLIIVCKKMFSFLEVLIELEKKGIIESC
jgi:hypothetical protein